MAEEVPRLYLITPPIADAAGFAAQFEAALAAADVACVLLRTASLDQGAAKKLVRALLPLAQGRGVACLVEDSQLASRAGADGAHLRNLGETLETALASLKPDGIVGVSVQLSRDDAMTVGETDVDYLMFGDPDEQHSFADILERVNWWAEIFNVPCVAFARKLEEIPEFACAGADFVAVEAAIWDDPRGVAIAMAEAAQALAMRREVTE